MAQFALPKNSRITKGDRHPAPKGAKNTRTFRVYRWDPEGEGNPRWNSYEVDIKQISPRSTNHNIFW